MEEVEAWTGADVLVSEYFVTLRAGGWSGLCFDIDIYRDRHMDCEHWLTLRRHSK